MNRGGRLFVVAAVAMAAVVGSVVSQELREQPDVASMSPADIVQLRIDIMKEDGMILGAAMDEGGEAGIEGARHLIHNVAILKTLFPEGSLAPNSKALESLWTEKEAFDALFDEVAVKAQEAIDAEESGDSDTFQAALREAAAICGDCHVKWRGAI